MKIASPTNSSDDEAFQPTRHPTVTQDGGHDEDDEDDDSQDDSSTTGDTANATATDDNHDDKADNNDDDNAIDEQQTNDITPKLPPAQVKGSPPPPTIQEVIEHIQDPMEKQQWTETLEETSIINQIYQTTATNQLQPIPRPASTIQVFTNWAATMDDDSVSHIATGLAIMEQGPGAWMQDAFEVLLRDKHPPVEPYLVRLTAADRFLVMHGRTSIRTSQPSAQKDLWAAFTVDANGDEERILFAKPYLFKSGKVISPIEMLQGQMLATGTKVTTNQHEQAPSVPTICPVPVAWAAMILRHPEWTAQATAQYIVSQLTLWDLTDTHVAATATRVLQYLCGALTAGSKNRPTVRFRFSANPASFDPPATTFLDNLSTRLWEHEVVATQPKQAPSVKREKARRTSTRLQQQRPQGPTATAASDPPKPNSGTTSNRDTQGDTPNPSNMDTQPNREQAPTSNRLPSKVPPKPTVGTAKAGTGTTKSLRKAPAPKRKDVPAIALAPLNLSLAPANKRSKRAATQQVGTDIGTPHGGAPRTMPAPAPPATPPTLDTSAAALTALLQSPDILARTIGALAQAQVTQANQLAEQRTMNQHFRDLTTTGIGMEDSEAPTARKTKWNDSKKARFAAWANLPFDSPLLPEFWPSLIQAASDDKEAVIAGLFNGLRDEHWEFQGWEPSPQLVSDIQKLVLRPPMMSESKYHRGINPMAFADVDLHELETAWANNAMLSKYATKLSLSTTEAMALEHKAPLQPRTLETLRLCIRRCMLFLKETLGNQCYYYVVVKDLCQKLLRLTQRLKHSPAFMQRRGPSILWELSHVGFDFFGQVFTASEFVEASQFDEPAPMATAPPSLDHLLSLDVGPSADLPAAWLPRTDPPGTQQHGGNGTGQATSGGGNGGKQQKQKPPKRTGQPESAWAPGFAALLSPYSEDQRRKVALKPLLQQANKDLKWLTRQLGVPAKQCMKSTVFGCCPDHCKLSHATNPPAPDKVAPVIEAFKPLVPSLFATT